MEWKYSMPRKLDQLWNVDRFTACVVIWHGYFLSQSVFAESFHSPVLHLQSTRHLSSCLPFPLSQVGFWPSCLATVPVKDVRLLTLIPYLWRSPPGSVYSWPATLLLLGTSFETLISVWKQYLIIDRWNQVNSFRWETLVWHIIYLNLSNNLSWFYFGICSFDYKLTYYV